MSDLFESEKVTRKKRIDPKLKKLGWVVTPYYLGLDTSLLKNHAVEEYPTESGPSDYALFVDGRLIGILEAKKVTVATINTLEQAKRYARGLVHSIGSWNGYMVPFLYSTNGELISFLDVRSKGNLARSLADFHTPAALKELFNRNTEVTHSTFQDTPNAGDFMRPYQKKAVEAIETNIIEGKRRMLVAMATGTGKTFMAVNSVYRLLKSGVAKRVLFLVDRKSLAAQTAVSFSANSTPAGNKFNQEYELFSQKFRKDDFEEGEKFDINVLPNEYLTKPDATKTFVYVCTIQRMAINLLGKNAVFTDDNNDSDIEEGDQLDIPIHTFDIIIADECHRGYTSQDTNVWRTVLEYFDAVKIGLTATPALHTVAYFGNPISRYPIEEAILDGYLVDYNAVKINSGIRMTGVFLKEGEQVEKVDTKTGQLQIENLEDERVYNATEVERKITVPDSNKEVIAEIAKYALEFEKEPGHFPKTLIFAVNDVSHTSHADQLVSVCKEGMPELTVTPRTYGSRQFFVGGEVARPGIYEMPASIDAFQAVALAGGFLPSAHRRDVLVLSRASGTATVTQVDLSMRAVRAGLPEAQALQRYDVVYVPRLRISQVNLFMQQYVRDALPVQFSFYYDLRGDRSY